MSLDAIEYVDLLPIKDHLIARTGLDDDSALIAVELYRKFLLLQKKHWGEALVPSALIDEVWHCHILDTRAYAHDCQLLFGDFLHHDPSIGEDAAKAGWARTKALFLKDYGLDLDHEAVGGPATAAQCN